jgi:16S rRNA (guanine966-N2)-methyltransferase
MRIIAGQYKGRRLLSPEGMTTRPITDRVKAALFNSLLPWLADAAVADLFCGTGSMGLEALSRGGRHCWFAERDPSAIEALSGNLQMVGAQGDATIWQGDILLRLPAWLAELPGKLDIIFLDPPYELAERWFAGEAEGAAQAVAEREAAFAALAGVLAEDGVLVFRTPRRLDLPAAVGGLTLGKRKEYGSMALNFFSVPDGP